MSNGPIVIVPAHARLGEGFSKKEKLKALEHPGRQTDPQKGYQSSAEWVTQLFDQKKSLVLCSYCRVKFNHKRHHYRKFYCPDPTGATDGYQANGNCDSCKQFTANCGGGTAYIHEQYYSQLCVDPLDARRKARAAAKAMSTWQMIQRQQP